MTEDICGYEKDNGEPCQRPSGWGVPADKGFCRDHAEEYRVPRKLDEETKSHLVGAARTGAMLKHCAQVAGITPQTLRNWLSDGEEHVENEMDTPLADFYFRFQRARGAGAVEVLNDCSPEFLASASFGYTKTETREITGEDGGPIEVVFEEEVVETEWVGEP